MNTTPYCIVTEDDAILEQDLSLPAAELALCHYLGHGEDCYIGLTADYTN